MNGRTVCLRRAGLFFSAVLFLLTDASAFAAKDGAPDWVKAAAAQPIPTYSPEINAVVLLSETTYSVDPDGTAIEHYRHVLKILRPQGREDATVRVSFDKGSKILSLHIWSIGPDRHEYALKDKEIGEYGYPGGGILYADEQYRIAKAPGADPGGIVAYEYEQRVRPYVNETTWFFQGSLPHVHQTFTLELPAGYTYTTVWAHHDAVKASDLEHQRWRWEMTDTPAVDLQHVLLPPSSLALEGRMTIHYGPSATSADQGTWKGIGEWYAPLAKDRLAATPEIAAKAKALVGDKTDFYEKTDAIAEFLQTQIRYFAIEMGIGGIQPHYAADIFHNRYGDCKDKATLFSSMLSTVGIHSTLVMVDHRRGVVDPEDPSIVGDHMIAAVEIPKGYSSPRLRSVVTAKTGRRYLIYDPTSSKTAYGQLEHELQGGYGLLLEGSDSEIIALPLLSPELNTVHRTAHFELKPDGGLQGTITEKRFGDVSETRRQLYTAGDAKEQGEFLDHLLEQDFTTFKVSGFKVENAASLNKDLTTSFSISADRYARTMGRLLMVRPRVLGNIFIETDHEKRTLPINLEETLQVSDDYEIALPGGYAVDEIPDPIKLDLGFASYESSSRVKDNVLHYTRTYTVRQVTLPAEKYDDVQKLAQVIATDQQSHAVLKKQ
ncbi:DUF3857 domain-containing transglutaminase family protein [Edaphobacter bradus]|uniref:DUF3857 domain-containing transglutaminase family protein n=1 Tax=Edaphobacter bradus TaxID=2259016 RepID=UPI0021DFD5EA|nr:DUF3857 and transglutaminase domain-containing protein [Edaphobacter bradus]